MQRSKEEIINKVKSTFPETPTDEQLELLEDLDDSIPTDNENWKQKYEDNDKAWRQKYADRFNGKVEAEEIIEKDDKTDDKKYLYSDLFKEE